MMTPIVNNECYTLIEDYEAGGKLLKRGTRFEVLDRQTIARKNESYWLDVKLLNGDYKNEVITMLDTLALTHATGGVTVEKSAKPYIVGDLDGLRARIHLAIDQDLNRVPTGNSNIWNSIKGKCSGCTLVVGTESWNSQEVRIETEITDMTRIAGSVSILRKAIHEVIDVLDLSELTEKGAFIAPNLIYVDDKPIQGIWIGGEGAVSVPLGCMFGNC